MILRERKIKLIIIFTIIIVVLAIGGLIFLLSNTDILSSKEKIFAKYFMQNFDSLDIIKNEDILEIKEILEENKYTSDMEISAEYTENLQTSNEDRDNPINDVKIKVSSKVDKPNNYTYRDIALKNSEEDLFKLEYLNQEQNYGIRFNGIKQFILADATRDNNILKEYNIENIESLVSEIDTDSIFNFSDSEKENLAKTYIEIIQNKISKDRYYKKTNSLITVNGQDVQANAYYVKVTLEEYNNICIDILNQIIQDEIILSKIDLIENIIEEKYTNYNSENSLRKKIIDTINKKIQKIKDNNIGNEEVRITVYENGKRTIRTSIEKSTNKIIIDKYNQTIKINVTTIGEINYEKNIEIERQNTKTNDIIIINYNNIKNNEIINHFRIYNLQEIENDKINKEINVEIQNERNKCFLNLSNNIEIANDFENKIKLDENNINLKDLSEEQIEIIKEHVGNQLEELYSVIDLKDIKKILQNLGIIHVSSVQLPIEGEVSEIERKRFNSQFEFFVSEDLTTDNVKELVNATDSNLKDIKILLKTGEIDDLDVKKISSPAINKEYIENISEILLYIKSNVDNEYKKDDIIKFLDYTNNNYDVSIEYNNNGLVEIIKVKVKEN